ncbi:MAG TPA: nucleoside transporter C-terminal domain-containing protein [Stellaceae bacterium]|jgi:CNT family concentrative nucleoside transporter|nr:nucleoside transporter C-terminal domain-containing protein [Stellaceae bacterium]
MRGLLGIIALLLLAWLLSENRWRIPIRTVVAGLALQLVLAVFFVKFPPAATVFLVLNHGVDALQRATEDGTGFVFGYLGGGPLPFDEKQPGLSYIFAFRALPLVLTISALASLLFYWGILQVIVKAFAWLLRRAMGIGGALGLGAAVHIFVGNIEAPLLVRPYLMRMERGELFALMSCGMAGIAGTVMVLYASILGPVIPDALGHILIASVISTPAALAVAALMVPFAANADAEAELTMGDPMLSAVDALAKGTADGIVFLANIIAMLVVAIACVSLVNMILSWIPAIGGETVTLQWFFGYLFRPVMWLIGVPGNDIAAASNLMATKTVLNEFIAYVDMAHLPKDAISDQTRLILTYAMCGFANFGSAGIMIGGMSAMAPQRKHDIVGLGLRSILSGTIATCMSGAVVGMLG